MQDQGRGQPAGSAAPTAKRLHILELMFLIAGAAVGLWLIQLDLRSGKGSREELLSLTVVMVLGGFSLVGPPLLLWERRRDRRPWRAGQVLWFTQGMASWLLWPPVVYSRVRGGDFSGTISGPCYYYGTPLMAIYVTTALLAGGWVRTGRRRTRRRSWQEAFGLILGLIWACTGFYVLYQFYRKDFRL
jgi:hypothetical protein